MCVFGLDKVLFVYFSIRCTQESKLKFGRTQESKLKFGSRRLAAAAGVWTIAFEGHKIVTSAKVQRSETFADVDAFKLSDGPLLGFISHTSAAKKNRLSA